MRTASRYNLRDRTVRFPSNPWWKQILTLRLVAVATAILASGSTSIFFARDAGHFFLTKYGHADGSLQVDINTATLTEPASSP